MDNHQISEKKKITIMIRKITTAHIKPIDT